MSTHVVGLCRHLRIMIKTICLLSLCLTAAVASPSQQRIVGGSLTTINQYPFGAAVLKLFGSNHRQVCGGTIINNRSVLSAAHCFVREPTNAFQIRVGSSFANSGGSVHPVSQIINHPNYNVMNNNDISVLRVSRAFTFGSTVQVGRIPGSNYGLADNQPVWVIGWGMTSFGGSPSEQLRHVQVWTVNQNICRNSYGSVITDNMLCAGHLNVGGRDSCTQDSGGPLLHNGVVVGVVSFGNGCGDGRFPGVYARVSRYTSWIQSNA
ncbi:trypsin CFT-1-like [Vanessa cardui]|uniref:trypsin CFT-1-like n=1 Tax=Vanessa cardui TaxID=171605 RepID=UPI001F12B8C9|nr:trypsin CFT-1-like [Vanessa cardui]